MHGVIQDSDTDNQQRDCYGTIARWYDDLYEFRNSVDLQYFLSCAARPGMRILELGCGTGRISIPLARAGHTVTALDLSRAMLDRMSWKLEQEDEELRSRISLVNASMSEFSLDTEFDLVLIPFRAFQHLVSNAEQRACLLAVREHLALDGRLVFDIFDPDIARIAGYVSAGDAFRQDLEVETPAGGLLRRYTRIIADTRRQVHQVTMRFEQLDGNGRVTDNDEENFSMRWMTHNEAVLLLELCGLAVENTLSAYDGSALEERRGDLIYTCRRNDGQ